MCAVVPPLRRGLASGARIPILGSRPANEREGTTMDPKEPDVIPRRQVIGGVLVGLAAATVSASASTEQAATGTKTAASSPSSAPARQNPVTEYAKPPFPSQTQPWPGLASKMVPRPDHGERRYRGSGGLRGRLALVTGGDFGIGRAAAVAFAREGADVAINYLPAEEPDAQEVVRLIRDAGRKAVALPGDIRDEAFCGKLVVDAVAQLGGLDVLVNNAAKQAA